MTEKGFLHRSYGRISAEAFIQAHREFLAKGSLGEKTNPILKSLDIGDMLPDPALSRLRSIVLEHLLDTNIQKGQQKLESTINKPYTATIFNNCQIVMIGAKKLIKCFNCSIHAQNWCDYRLYEGAQQWYAKISHTSGRTIHVDRLDSIARMLKQRVRAVTKNAPQNSQPWKMRAKGDRFYFSKG